MIGEKELLSLFDSESIMAFKTTTLLDEDTDVIIDATDEKEFIRFCKLTNSQLVFYNYLLQTKESVSLAEDEMLEELLSFIQENSTQYRDFIRTEIDASEIIEKYTDLIHEIILKRNCDIEKMDENVPIILEMFTLYQNEHIGISIYESSKETKRYQDQAEIIDELKEQVESEIEKLLEEQQKNSYQEWQKREEEKKEKFQQAENEIAEELKESEKLMECTNGKLRHNYARDLAYEYSEKYDINITIGSVESMVEQEYKKRK